VSSPLVSATTGFSFDGPGANGYAPSDSNIAVGPNHIFTAVNSVYQIYGKTGASLVGPKTLSSLWTGVGGGCSSANAGDVVVQYDKLADRWILTQLSSLSSPYGECIAVSTSNDPTGSYYTYYYSFGSNLPDYPKFGVWPTASNGAYLATYNQFSNGSSFVGAALCAYNRSAMLAGMASPAQICYTINDASYLPSDLDGSTAPVDGTPGYFLTYETLSSLRLYTLKPNFSNPPASVLSQASPDLSVTPFSELCSGGTCVPQAGTNNQLDSLGDRPMYRLAFRNFGGHESLVFNHSVTSGVRWYELQSPVSATGTFSLFQQGTYAPDATYRWMGSAAMDQAGDLAIGYSASSSAIHPAVRYSGRVPSDTPGTLESEASIMEGAGSQTNGLSRWGDYSSLRIDPADDCTFWYINEYLASSGAFNWKTRVGSFKFSGCGGTVSPDFSLSVNPASLAVSQGSPASSTITVSSTGGYNGIVQLSVTNCPAGASCTFSSGQVSPPANGSTTSTLTVTGAGPGNYSLNVVGSDGTRSHNATFSLTVNAPAGDFNISVPPTITVIRKSSTTVTVSVTAVGNSSSVTLSISGLPNRTSSSFSVNPVTTSSTSSSSLTISAAPPAVPGSYPVTITGTSSTQKHSATATLIIQ
jgi:hypothetical protein